VTITVRWFAQLREQRGCSEEAVQVPEGSRVSSVLEALALPPGLRVATAVNTRIVGPDTALCDGDELAVLPPMGGG
jgi:molybdopterin converting factor small subunit